MHWVDFGGPAEVPPIVMVHGLGASLELGRTSPHDAYTPSMAFAVSFPPHDPRFGPNKQIFSGEASYEISAAAVLTITHEQAGKLRQRHFAPGSWLEVEDNVDPPE